MITHFADRLIEAIREKNAPVCVGLDPLMERFPSAVLRDSGIPWPLDADANSDYDDGAAAESLFAFGREVIGVVARHVPAVKINIAFFERYHSEGVRAYFELVEYARRAGLIVIGDVKRADIGHSAGQYARAHLGGLKPASPGTGCSARAMPDAVTVNPYFGLDSIRPFIEQARDAGQGVFVLVQTSNESADQVQSLHLSDGSLLCERVADLVQTWASGEGLIGDCNYSCIGAVVSPRDLPSTISIRARMPNCLFLVPGFGAQGRTTEEVAKCFHPDGRGAIVNASRSVIYAYQDKRYAEVAGNDWRHCIEQACTDFISAIRKCCPGS